MARNVVLKAKVTSLAPAERACALLNAKSIRDRLEIDTYFFAKGGRLKLSETQHEKSSLIHYQRASTPLPREGFFWKTSISQTAAPGIKGVLAQGLGVRTVVTKWRKTYLWDSCLGDR